MTKGEIDKLVSDSVSETIDQNQDLIKTSFQKSINSNESEKNFVNVAIECVNSGAKIGAIAAISALCKLGIIDIDKIDWSK